MKRFAWLGLTVFGCLLLRAAVAQDADRAALEPRVFAFSKPPVEFAGKLGDYKPLLVKADGTPIKTADEWKTKRKEIKAHWMELLGPWPQLIESPKAEVLEEEKRGEILQQHLRLEVAPGKLTEDCYRLIPPGKGPFPAVVVVFYDAKTGIGLAKPMRDFAWQLAQRGYVALSLGSAPETYYPDKEHCKLQPLSFHAYEAANCCTLLQKMPQVDPARVGIVGHSYGGKWAMFASALHEPFACACWSDPGIVFDEKRGNVNYWERWYIGFDPKNYREKPGIPTKENPAQGPYKKLVEEGRDLHELHALLAPRPFLVSGGAEDQPERWIPLNHSIAVNDLLGVQHRVAMTNRKNHDPSEESNQQMGDWFDYWLKKK